MENYVVSARKYRPASFESVVGQQHITSTLKHAISTGQLGHAFLFCGPRGVGKTTCARILAKTVNCEHLTPEHEACNECETCRSFIDGSSMNIFELDAASNNSVDDIRELIRQIHVPPQTGKYKVYIIDEVHALSLSAFQAFLKTLEEPLPYVMFILATTEKHKVPATILSRCQVFDFKRIQTEDVVNHLKYVAEHEHVQYEPQALHLIAKQCDGGMRDALSTFDMLSNFTRGNITYKACIEVLSILDYEYYFRLVDYLRAGNVAQSLLLYSEVRGKGFDGQHFLSGLAEHLRNLIVCTDPAMNKLLEADDELRVRYGEQAVNCGLPLIVSFLDVASDYEYRYREANNKQLFTEVALMKLATLASRATAPAPVRLS